MSPSGRYVNRPSCGDQQIIALKRIVLRTVFYSPPPTPPPDYSGTYALTPPLSINGRLFIESRQAIDLHEAKLALLSTDPDLPSPPTVLARPDGQFSVNGIVSGSYVMDIAGLPPGSYRLFAWEHLEPNAYLNSDYIRTYEALSVPVTIASGDNPPVAVRWIPKD